VNRSACSILVCAVLAGCAPALREPPSLAEMAGAERPAGPEEGERLLAEADSLLRQPDAASMRAAADAYLRAAAEGAGGAGALIGAVRARVWLADHVEEPEAREAAATGAVEAAQWCGRVDPGSAECDYWLAVALGIQARERRSTALDALPRIVELLERAAAEPEIDEAGPHRVLALVLLRAPGWPSGPGDPDRGLEEARRAVELRPEHPPNQLCLGEALDKTGDAEAGREAFREAARLARESLRGGERDAPEWLEQAERALGRGSGD